ncbi:Txe/YoeB family addiction module toxin [Solwaraspora sp. WMMB762]|uniref:Txe/YoeB family addiction module toxin n=1 Tax=Solwaraspora sp. WMMB762 TaxID=3404120 RepID=UPI003B9357BD
MTGAAVSGTKLIKRINDLIVDVMRNGYECIGKPEPLRGELSGFWSRRIDREHRLVYRLSRGGGRPDRTGNPGRARSTAR